MAFAVPSRLKWFDPRTIGRYECFVAALVGARKTGKTTLLTDMLWHTHRNFDFGLAMTATHSTVQMLTKYFATAFVFAHGYDFEKADQFLALAKDMTENNKRHHVLLLLDDLGYDKKIMKSEAQREIHMNGRHSFISVITTFQYSMDIPYDLRGQIDFLFALMDVIPANQKRLFQYFFGQFVTLRNFSRTFNLVTRDRGVLVWIKESTGAFENSVQYYKADPNAIGDFRIGRRIYHAVSRVFMEMQRRAKERAKHEQRGQKFVEL